MSTTNNIAGQTIRLDNNFQMDASFPRLGRKVLTLMMIIIALDSSRGIS
jgi:hypothetical protein